ncbi:MAG: glycoside hydrolase family 1 protein [Syntrophaceae bacterium]|nr:glycoside hydrolase family 1 protein [Syntrophaceae bacterium]
MPDRFLWGVATSAFQLEGSPNADWTAWDERLRSKPNVTNHYSLYKKDLKFLKELGVNAYRFSLEWSRIQPEEDQWDTEAVRHYQDIVDILHGEGIEPMLTLHHFTHPRWFLEKYPWHEDRSVKKFLVYVEKVVSTLRGVRYWITINEPYVLLLGGYLDGCMPPGLREPASAVKALKNMLLCHGEAYDILHSLNQGAEVGVAHNMAAIAPCRFWHPLDRALSRIAMFFYNHSLIDAFLNGTLRVRFPFKKAIEMEIPVKGKVDFMGVNYYTRIHLRFNPFRKMGVELRHQDEDGHGLTDTGWEVHPTGLERVLRYASKLKVPIIITENGIATRDDQKKIKFIKAHVDALERCLENGIDVRGYFYWSLIDHYEWLRGFDTRFGLYTVDFTTFERKRTSAATYYSYLINKNLKS